jgi:flagellar basal body rod protein FlgG
LPNGIQLGAGVRTSAVYRITSQGALESTSNTYDFAIQGPGYFRVTLCPTARILSRVRGISRCRPRA